MLWIGIQARQKGVCLARLKDEARVEAFSQEMAETRFSDTNQTFNDNVVRQKNTPND